jgi:hypothetical protein
LAHLSSHDLLAHRQNHLNQLLAQASWKTGHTYQKTPVWAMITAIPSKPGRIQIQRLSRTRPGYRRIGQSDTARVDWITQPAEGRLGRE